MLSLVTANLLVRLFVFVLAKSSVLLPQEKKGMLNGRFWVNAGMHYGPNFYFVSSKKDKHIV
jgi:hypothetical protein